jgi:hypothetical protein
VLVHRAFPEIDRDRVGRVIALRLRLLLGHERDVAVLVAEKRNGLTTYGAGESAAVVLLKLDRIREPPEHVVQRVDGETDQHLAPFGAVIVREHALVLLPRFEAEAHEIALGTTDSPGLELRLETDCYRYRDPRAAPSRGEQSPLHASRTTD